MKLSIRHRITYSYGSDVSLEPHTLRLWPRIGPSTRLVDLDLRISPAPVVRAENLDKEGNNVIQVWFDGTTAELAIDSRVEVETLMTDPFRFLVTDPEWKLPYLYPPGWGPTLAPYRCQPDQITGPARRLALAIATEADRDQLGFPLALARAIHRDFEVEIRESGEPRSSDETAHIRRGACRDLSVLFVDCCRAMGLAARFVSGYVHVADTPRADLHAWAEVYLPGGGWRGYDPSYGLAVADRHVVLAAAADSADAAVVTGTFRGGDANTRFSAAVSITHVAPDLGGVSPQ